MAEIRNHPSFMYVLVACKNEENSIKMKSLERPQHFPDYKSNMGIFQDAQEQLNPPSVVK